MARFIFNIICLWICVSANVLAQDTGKIKPKLITLNIDSSDYESIVSETNGM